MEEPIDVAARWRPRAARPWLAVAGLVAVFGLAVPAGAQTSDQAPAQPWKFSGDFRFRFERTGDQEPTPDPLILDPRYRYVVRLRAGASKQFGNLTSFGVRVATGSRGDPNSTDITLGDFADRLELSVDRAYLELKPGGAFVTAGKFANPFMSTELVWDGDVNPQGVAASYALKGSHRLTPKLIGLFYVVDEQTINPDSYMAGVQGQLTFRPSQSWSLALAGAYYAYNIKSLRNADSGDTRSNRLNADRTRYLSDFDLLDGVLTLNHRGFGGRFPVSFVADFVKNLGADDQNTGFGFDLFVGRASARGDLRFRYGYAEAGTDAVLAAFSHDNTTLATNYKQHTLTFDYQVLEAVQLNATWYLYHTLRQASATDAWVDRLRLNALVSW